ncbi:MAG: peptidylprolyl isomerase, partial [Clostridia bacterium]|nr:peptidylprolyl isomerase [Clostridia bacterium]
LKEERIREHVAGDITVSDDEVKANFDEQVAAQKESFDATPSLYMTYQNYGYDTYYIPAGYRGVKHVLVKIDDAKQTEIDTLTSTVSTSESAIANATSQLEELKAEDTAAYDEEAKTAYDEQVAALEEQLASEQANLTTAQEQLTKLTEEAFAEILPTAEEVLAKAQAGENFDDLIAAYGEDPGMESEPNKTQGYMVCEGLATYEQAFQDGAMALENVGDISDLVKTSYGYHILQYTCDIEAGAVEMTEEIKTAIHDELLTTAQDAAYEAAITQWVTEAKPEKFPKIMK